MKDMITAEDMIKRLGLEKKRNIMNIDYSKITNNSEVVKLLKQRLKLEAKIKALDPMALINHESELLSLPDVSQSVAEEWGKFIIICEREGRPLLLLEDYIEQYCG